jgi:tRNA-specific 2-thiouridylase
MSSRKAVALFSGGLDSILAIKLIQQQGIEVEAVYFEVLFSPMFCPQVSKIQELDAMAEMLGCKFHYIDIVEEYLTNVLLNPKWGYGKSINPCVDCHAYMFKKAGDFMRQIGADFIITGEVMGERPMSQKKDRLYLIAKESGYKDYILRPLSAKHLNETTPELEGWVDREKLEKISGRSRKRQIELAREFGIEEYPSPAGGCAYTEKNFGKRVKDFISYGGITPFKLCLAKIGRHFRGDDFKVILGRKHIENLQLDSLGQKDKDCWRGFPVGFTAPTALLLPFTTPVSKEVWKKVANLIVRYGNKVATGKVVFISSKGEKVEIEGERKDFTEMGLIQL